MKDLCRLFLYGTLLPGLAPAALRGTVSRMSCIGPAIVRGVLYDFGSFPGALLRAGDEGRIDEGVIRGEVFELPATDLVALDEYEGFDREDIAGSLFVRKECEARLRGRLFVSCWIYVYNRPFHCSVRIPDGDYVRWRAKHRG